MLCHVSISGVHLHVYHTASYVTCIMAFMSKIGKASPGLYAAVGFLILGLVILIVGVTVDIKCSNEKSWTSPSSGGGQRNITGLKEFCKYSPEAERIGLDTFLKRVKAAYYENMPNQVAYDPDVKFNDRFEDLKKRLCFYVICFPVKCSK